MPSPFITLDNVSIRLRDQLDVVCSGWFDSVGLYRQCSPQQRESAIEWLEKLGLRNHIASHFGQLAEGEQRLTLLARAFVKNPPLLILDEPCQGLDDHNRALILQAIDALWQSTASMIYVTHRADEMPQSITHVLRLNEGQVEKNLESSVYAVDHASA